MSVQSKIFPNPANVEAVARAMCVAYGIDPDAASLGADGKMRRAWEARMKEAEAAVRVCAEAEALSRPYQDRVQDWMQACFGREISKDGAERCHRFTEEALELVQSLGMSSDDAHALVDYVYGRPLGEPDQEVGGVMVTLAALCTPFGLNLNEAAEKELSRVWTKVDQIRAKQAAKPKGSPLAEVTAAAD